MIVDDTGYLYVIKDTKQTGWFKVGKTSSPSRRLNEYNNSFPEDRIEYELITERIHSLSLAEGKMIELLSIKKNIIFAKDRREWVKHSSASSGATAFLQIMRTMFVMLEEEFYYGDFE